MAATRQARRRVFLDGLADTALAQEDTSRAAARERKRLAAEDAQRRKKNITELRRAWQDYETALGEAERGASEMAVAMERARGFATEVRALTGGLGVAFPALSEASMFRRWAQYLCAILRSVSGDQSRFGQLRLVSWFPQAIVGDSWVDHEQQAVQIKDLETLLGEDKTNGE